MNPPQQLNYSNIRPRGWYSKFKQWPVEPLSSNLYWNPNQIVRFQLMLTSGVLDPYRSSINLTVSTPDATNFPLGGLQVDSSAQSFINQLVISSNNVQIQRIAEYDTLAAYLTDIGFSQTVCENRQWQGLGYQNYQISGLVNKQAYPQEFTGMQASGGTVQNVIEKGCIGISPTKAPGTLNYAAPAFLQNGVYTYLGGPRFSFNCTPSHLSNSNPFFISPDFTAASITAQMNVSLADNGRYANIRADYVPQTCLRGQIDSTSSYRTSAFKLSPSPVPATWSAKSGGTGVPYTPSYPKKMTSRLNTTATGVMTDTTVDNISPIFGYTKPYSAKFGVGGHQPFISPTIPQTQFGYGQVSAIPVPVSTKKFQFPLLSSVIGVLLPHDQFKLLPLRALYNLLIQLTLNPYAMFTTGRQDVYQFDAVGILKQIPRSFQISRLVYNLHIYQWPEQDANIWINENLTKQIAITGSSWFLSSQYQIANGQQVRNNWQINTTSQSLGQIVCLFLSNQYLKYTYCRKQFRLSNNIRSLQLKFNTQYFPPQPITGNAGNPQTIDSSGDNADFLQLLLLSNDYKFATNTPHPRINSYNFAINSRCYDPSNTSTFYGQNIRVGATTLINSSDFNGDTAMGLPWFHQNRFIGKAAYTYSFQPYGHSKNYMTGINTMNARPFDVVFDAATTNYFPSDQTLYIFSRANVINVYGSNGIRVIGR